MEKISLICPLCCGKSFSSKVLLIEHLSTYSKKYSCSLCPMSFDSIPSLIEHINTCNEIETITNEKIHSNLVETCDDDSLNCSSPATFDLEDEIKDVVAIQEKELETEMQLAAEEEKEIQGEEEEELYSCNICGVTFKSVYEHIQTFHNNQQVVVEVNEEGSHEESDDNSTSTTPIEIVTLNNEEPAVETHTGTVKRVITGTGDIIETSQIELLKDTSPVTKNSVQEISLDKKGLVYTRKYVKIEKFWNDDQLLKKQETATPAPPPAEKATKEKLIYHHAVKKQLETTDGINKVEVYHCISCNTYAMTLDELKTRPCKKNSYSCSSCDMVYNNPKSLCAHKKVHKPREEVLDRLTKTNLNSGFTCEVCCTVFPTNKSLRLHSRMHDPVKPQSIEQPVTDNDKSNTDFASHFHCTVCDKWIPTGFKSIHEDSHRPTDQFNCEICNREFKSKDYLLMHMSIHTVDKMPTSKSKKTLPYNCSFCKRQFARPHEKVKHERIHTGEKPHSCEICGKSFRVAYCLTLHMRTHTGERPYECQHCGKRFKAHSVYNHHMMTHSEVRAYKCPYCPKAFKTSVQLSGHKNSHTKPFSCTQCNRPFASLYAVRIHSETHRRQNNLKYSCSLCGATYARMFALRDHIKQSHMGEEASIKSIEPKTDDKWVTAEVINDSTMTISLKGESEMQDNV